MRRELQELEDHVDDELESALKNQKIGGMKGSLILTEENMVVKKTVEKICEIIDLSA